MKKIFIALMIILLSIFSFVSCDGGGNSSNNVDTVDIEDVDDDDSPVNEEPPVVNDDEDDEDDPVVVHYHVVYSISNANQIGTVPVDDIEYTKNANVVVKSNTLIENVTANDSTVITKEFVGWSDDDNIYEAGDTFTITEDVVLYAVFADSAVRGITTTGYVFYDKGFYSDGWRYIECAKNDTIAIRWWDTINTVACNLTSTNPNFYIIGAGKSNTETIITLSGSLLYMAAGIVHVPTMGGNVNWYVPSAVEFEKMMINIKDHNMGNFKVNTYYWTSNDYNKDNAYAMNTSDPSEFGTVYQRAKYSNNYYVRPIRYF